MNSIIKYILNMLPIMLISLPIILVIRYFRIKTLAKKSLQTSLLHEVFIVLFIVFLSGLASITIIPKIELGNPDHFIVGFGMGTINLIPFKVIEETYTAVFVNGYFNYFLINFLGNIVMFIPIGFFTPLLWRNISFKKTALIGALTSLFIEVCQLPQARGSDIDDIWINTLGSILGFAIFMIFEKNTQTLTDKFRVSDKIKMT